MRPTQTTPHQAAQWIMEAHADNIVGNMSEREHTGYLTALELVCDEMDASDLRRTLGAVVDIACELVLTLADNDVDDDKLLELVRHGRGRLHVVGGLPSHPATIDSGPAFRLAELIANNDVWAHNVGADEDARVLDAYEMSYEEAEAAISTRTLDQLFLVGYYLGEFSETLREAGAQLAQEQPPCLSPDGAACRGHITCRSAKIRNQSRALCGSAAGSMSHVADIHREFFATSAPSTKPKSSGD
ncbi:hypothetical protein [Nocardioides sp. 1609]|uniref:hypothetical protein n=1 Tax=Nocardioides sp. 1609 TaxID=2508327 RepID=UPI00106F66FA|nr:hypothetical protein [Nocardioides sp. 1609]